MKKKKKKTHAIAEPASRLLRLFQVNLSSVLPEVLSQLGAFLRKSQRALKVGALACLTALLTHHAAAAVTAAPLQPVLGQLPALLDDSDMHVSQVACTRGSAVRVKMGEG